jgi:small subunit ribosomal protein S1
MKNPLVITSAETLHTQPTTSGSGGEMSFAELFEQSLKEDKFREGEVVRGTVMKIAGEQVVVDIGYKSEGQISLDEFRDGKGEITVKAGDEIDVMIESTENELGSVVLSKHKADMMRAWDKISEACEKDQVVEGNIVARVKGGLSVDIGVKAFLPGSQVDLRPVKNLDAMIGQRFKFKVIKFNKKRGNIVLSRRALLEKEREALKKDTIGRLEEGKIVDGIVKNITDYGAFIDLGGLDGLLHITDMSWGRIQHPSELFQVGDEVKVKVIKYDQKTERVSLGFKQITPDPWTTAGEKHTPGTRVKGKVVSLTDYGAFVELEPGIEGLIHISEMSWTKRVKHPSQVVNVGDQVEAAVLDIDVENKRISLGMKQVMENPWKTLEEKYPVGTKVQGKVRNITDFGIFVGIEEGIDGLVHVSDLSWTQKVKHPSELFKKGQDVDAVVLNIDPENERFSLGIKQLTSNPWETVEEKYAIGTRVKGQVQNITDFGVFVELEPGVEGLVHVSEIADRRIENPANEFTQGQEVEAMVISVDPTERKISLSIKALAHAGEAAEIEAYVQKGKAQPKPGSLGSIMGDDLREALSGKGGKKGKKGRRDSE